MTAASRKLASSDAGSSLPYDAGTWQNDANREIGALWRYAGYPLTGVGGTANAITATSDTAVVTAITSYLTGMKRTLIPTSTNTAAATINIDSVGVANLKDRDGNALVAGSLISGKMYILQYDGTNWRVNDATMNGAPGIIRVVTSAINFNSANTDNAITIQIPSGMNRYRVNAVIISGASASISTATCGLFTAAAAGGTAIVTSASAITVTSSAEGTNNNMQSLTVNNSATQSFNSTTLYFRVQTAQGSAATATVTIDIQPVS